MKKLVLILSFMAIASFANANQTCYMGDGGVVICSNPDGSWG